MYVRNKSKVVIVALLCARVIILQSSSWPLVFTMKPKPLPSLINNWCLQYFVCKFSFYLGCGIHEISFLNINCYMSSEIVFCCIAAWIQPNISGCQQDFLVVWRWNQLRTLHGIFEKNLWNCSRKYTKMFKTDSFLDNKKLSFNQNVWRDHATMQQDVLLHFWVIFLY